MRFTRYLSIIPAIPLLAVLLVCCGGSAASAAPPDQVVKDFYHWYLGYPGNPIINQAYQSRTELAPSFVKQVDALFASDEGGRYDPFLLAQDIPFSVDIEVGIIEGETASVLLHQFWGGNDSPRDLEVQLSYSGEAWQITGVAEPAD